MNNYAPSLANSKIKKADLRTEARRELARRSLFEFTRYTFPQYKPQWFHELICDYLDRFVAGEIKRLMILMPPRHGKSEHVSRRLPAYILGRNPDARILATSYGASLAEAMNRDVQRIIDSEPYAELFPETRLSGANVRTLAHGNYLRNSEIFETVGHRGYYKSPGVGGPITGYGGDYIIIDDPHKNFKEANSPTVRESVWEWYSADLYTRLEDNASILLTVTRWHSDDLAGRLISAMEDNEDADQWVILKLPAVAEGDLHPHDIRQPGEALWPEKYPIRILDKIRAQGEYKFSALYQQTPTAKDGGIFKTAHINIIRQAPPNVIRAVRFWDLAMSERTTADWSAGVKMGLTSDYRLVILNVHRRKEDWDQLANMIEKIALQDGKNVLIGIEKAFMQAKVIQKLMRRPSMLGYVIRGIKPHADKITRALSFAGRVAEGEVDMVQSGWNAALKAELAGFPHFTNDDMVDACSGAEHYLEWVSKYGVSLATNGEPAYVTSEELADIAQEALRDVTNNRAAMWREILRQNANKIKPPQ